MDSPINYENALPNKNNKSGKSTCQKTLADLESTLTKSNDQKETKTHNSTNRIGLY